jgi:hypothetical protein
MNRHIATLVVAASLLTLPSIASAEHLKFTLGGSDSAVTDTGYDHLSDSNFFSMGQLGADFSFVEGFWVGLEYNWGIKRDTAYEGLDTTLDVDGLLINARYEYDVASFVAPYVQVGGGFYHMELDANINGETREADDFAGTFLGLVGFELHVPTKIVRRVFGISKRSTMGDLTFGLTLEGGYRVVSNASFNKLVRPEPDKKPDPEDLPLDTTAAQFGDIDFSGVVMRSALVVRF